MTGYRLALVQLPLVREAPTTSIRTPEDTYQACMDIAELAQECFQVLLLDVKNNLLDRHMVSLGVADSSLVHPREAFRAAIRSGAAAVVLVHNHPSGDPTPSAEDLWVTRQLVAAGKIIDVRVMDHVVIGRPAPNRCEPFLSMRERGCCDFSQSCIPIG